MWKSSRSFWTGPANGYQVSLRIAKPESMQLQAHSLNHFTAEELLERTKTLFPDYQYDRKRHQLLLNDAHQQLIGSIRLPLHLSITDELDLLSEEATALYLALESGYAAICIMEGQQNTFHTTFSAYMTRKKQGFSQLKYLKKKGKSRAGSRVRLAESAEFFDNINLTLAELFEMQTFDRIALSCSTSLIPFLFQAREECPFDKKDERLYKIPLHIPQANYTNLDEAIRKLSAPTVLYKKEHTSHLQDWLEGAEGEWQEEDPG